MEIKKAPSENRPYWPTVISPKAGKAEINLVSESSACFVSYGKRPVIAKDREEQLCNRSEISRSQRWSSELRRTAWVSVAPQDWLRRLSPLLQAVAFVQSALAPAVPRLLKLSVTNRPQPKGNSSSFQQPMQNEQLAILLFVRHTLWLHTVLTLWLHNWWTKPV